MMLSCLRSPFIFLTLFFSLVTACASSSGQSRDPASSGPLEHAYSKLRAKGMSERFLRVLQEEYREDERNKVLDLNFLGFLKVRPPEDERIPASELRRVQTFLNEQGRAFRFVTKKFPVPKEVIASLLWVETKYGRDLGTFHVASSFLSLAQADYPTILDQVMDLAKTRTPNFTPEIEQRILDRAKSRAEWAVGELMALEELGEKGYVDPVKLEGSFSGAFGMAQFIPSSYLSWAKGRRGHPNLFTARDSIYSVANYLTENGWKKWDTESHKAALFHYNRDVNYVNRILRMGECVRSPAKRKLWEKRRNGSC